MSPGGVTPEEIEFARNILRARTGDIYTALIVVGILGNKSDKRLVEGFIHGEENDVFSEAALKSLCRYMGLIDKYRPLLRSLVMNSTDEVGARRLTAIHLMKEYFIEFEDNELACHLVKILCDTDDRGRLAARSSLADILGLSGSFKDPHGLDFDVWDEDAARIVDAAKDAFGCSDIPTPSSRFH